MNNNQLKNVFHSYDIEGVEITHIGASIRWLRKQEILEESKEHKVIQFKDGAREFFLQLALADGEEIYKNDLLFGLFQKSNIRHLSINLGKSLTFIPPQIGNLGYLQILDLQDNNLTALPDEIQNLDSLIQIILNNNPFYTIPLSIFELKNLSHLEVQHCRLHSLPKEIGGLINLETLSLTGNKVANLPPEIRSLNKLTRLHLTKNPLPIPPEILEKYNEPQTILNYYFSIVSVGPSIPKEIQERIFVPKGKSLNEIKLLVVGQGSVGKTSLVQQILHGTFDQNQTKTEGISINQWSVDRGRLTVDSKNSELSTDNHQPIKLNIWDFGGQEIMHATHQFFLTKRSLYLLVLDARLTQEENRVEYWLKIIQSFGGESPVLIVGNKTDQHPLDIDRTGLQKKYPNIVGILETSAATGAGIDALKAEIAKQVDILPHVRDLLPETWFTVKYKLEELGRDKNFITQDEYLGLCGANDVTDETSQHTLIGFLHDLGVVLHFQDDRRLAELGILNPQWVTNGAYKILNHKLLFENKGLLTLSMLDEILSTKDYPRNKRLFIVEMMMKFELCYEIDHDHFLIPDLLPKDEPEDIHFKGVAGFQYQYPVLPSSVLTRFIVRMNKNIYRNVSWRTGVVLKIGENTALVKADIEERKITISIDGLEHTRRDTLSAIRYQLDEIHDSIKGLNPQKYVPIPDAPNAEPLDYDYLLQLERDGFEEHPVKAGNRLVKINVRKLLSGIESESQRKENLGNVTNIYVGGNVSGNIVVGDENTVENTITVFKPIYHAIDESTRDAAEKQDLIAEVDEIKNEVAKGDNANESFLSRRFRNLKKMAPDIADLALTTLSNPAAGVGIIVTKVAKKIKEETK